mgnify:CR=1 FL=1
MSEIQINPGKNIIRVPIFSPGDERAQSVFGEAFGMDQILINMIPAKQSDGSIVAEKRPGAYIGLNSLPALSGTGSIAKDNILFTTCSDIGLVDIWDTNTSKVYIYQYLPATGSTGTPAEIKIGEISGVDHRDWIFLTELTIGGVPTLGVTWTKYDKSTSKGYYATSTGTSFTASSLTLMNAAMDVDFPTATPAKVIIGPFVQMDFTTYIMTTDGGIYNSDTNSITSWNSLGVAAAQAYPYRGVGICRYKNFIVAFGEDSIEFFDNVGNPPPESPLQRTDQAFIKFGCADPKLFRTVDDNLYWVAAGSGSTQGLWTLDNFVPRKLTNRKQDNIITEAYGGDPDGSPHSMHLRSLLVNGENNLLITGIKINAQLIEQSSSTTTDSTDPVGTQDMTHRTSMMAYNIGSQTVWYIADMTDLTNGTLYWLPAAYQPIAGGAFLNKWLNIIFKGSTGATGSVHCDKLYALDSANTANVHVDYPNPAVIATAAKHRVMGIIQMTPMDFGSDRRKFVHRASLIMDYLYQSSIAGYGDSMFYFYFARDEYGGSASKSFRKGILLSSTNYRYYTKNLGSARRWNFGFVNWSGHSWRVKFLELDITQGAT